MTNDGTVGGRVKALSAAIAAGHISLDHAKHWHPGTWLWLGFCLLLPLALYWISLPRSLTLEDAGLFQLVCHEGGISHPPGYPLFTLACQSFTTISWFENPIVAGNFLSSLFGALACACLFLVSRELGLSAAYAGLIALAYGVSNAFWSQSIIIEVYSLGVLTFLICMLFAARFGRDGEVRDLYWLAFFYGLALSNHWPVIVLSSVGLLLLILNQWQAFLSILRQPLYWVLSLGLFALGLSPYLTLLQTNPEIAIYGANDSFSDLVRYINRSAYSDEKLAATMLDKWHFAIWLVNHSIQQLGWVCLPIIMVGIWRSFADLSRWWAWALVALYLGTTQVLNLMLGFTFEYRYQSIFHPYPLTAYLSLAIWLGLGARWLTEKVRDQVSMPVMVVLLSLLPLSALISNYGQNNRHESLWVELYGRTILEALPKNAVLFTYGDYEVAVLGYLQRVEGVRPDIEIREWFNLVLPNRLTSPSASRAEQDRVRTEFIEQQPNSVFSVRDWGVPSVSHGLFHRIDSNAKQRSEYIEGFEPLLDLVIEAYQNDLLWNAQEHELAYSVMIKFGRHYTQLLLDNGGLPDAAIPRYTAIRNTMPGELSVLETLLKTGYNATAKPELMNIVQRLLAREAEGLYRHDLAYLHYFHGHILSLPPADEAASLNAYRTAFDIYPTPKNPAYCLIPEHKTLEHCLSR